MIIPIGHEESSCRRIPWVTFTLIGLCFASLILANAGLLGGVDEGDMEQRFYDVTEYYFEHPYLDPGPKLREMAGDDVDFAEIESMMTYLGEAAERPAPEVVREEQAELDRLVDRAIDAVDSHPYMRFGLIADDMTLLGLIAHMFMHAGWLHLLGNMLMLYLAGPYLEDVWGRPLFAGFYAVAGLAAALTFVAMHPDVTIPLVGASGAIAGLMGAFMIRYWNTQIRFFYIFSIFIRGTFSAPAWLMLPLWLAQQLFMAVMAPDVQAQGGGVAYWAHIGGFVFGAAGAYAIRHQRIEERYIHAAIESKTNASIVDNSAVESALAAHERGQSDAAFQMLAAEVREHPTNCDAAIAYWAVAGDLERLPEAAPAMLRAIDQELRARDVASALRHWDEVSRAVPNVKVPANLCVRLAEAFAAEKDSEEATTMIRRALLEAGTRLDPPLALRIAKVGKNLDPRVAAGALRVALGRPEIDPDMRAQLEGLLAEVKRRTDGVPVG